MRVSKFTLHQVIDIHCKVKNPFLLKTSSPNSSPKRPSFGLFGGTVRYGKARQAKGFSRDTSLFSGSSPPIYGLRTVPDFPSPPPHAAPLLSRVAGTLARRNMTCGRSLLVQELCGVFEPPCRGISEADHDGKPAHAVEVLVVAGPGDGTVGVVDWCDEHEKCSMRNTKKRISTDGPVT